MTWKLWSLRRHEAKCQYIVGALVILLGCFSLAVPIVHAGIISTYKVTQVSPPAGGVTPGATTTIPDPIVFAEGNGLMPVNMPVDLIVAADVAYNPVVSGGVVNPFFVPGVIPAGTPYESYFFHFDPGVNGGFYPSSGSIPSEIDFSTQILGLQLFGRGAGSPRPLTGTLPDGDAISPFGTSYYPGTATTNEQARGVESGDSLGITNGRKNLLLSGLAFGGQVDQIRVFVAAVPEPATLAMAFVGLAGIMVLCLSRARVRVACS
jgi:hypothetical protein